MSPIEALIDLEGWSVAVSNRINPVEGELLMVSFSLEPCSINVEVVSSDLSSSNDTRTGKEVRMFRKSGLTVDAIANYFHERKDDIARLRRDYTVFGSAEDDSDDDEDDIYSDEVLCFHHSISLINGLDKSWKQMGKAENS